MIITTKFPKGYSQIEIRVHDEEAIISAVFNKKEAEDFKQQLLAVVTEIDLIIDA